jgi:hypothetical protein
MARPEPGPYSMVYYHLTPDEAAARRYLESLRDLGARRVHALVYWWQAETLGGDYWKNDYPPETIGEGHYAALDHFVHISRELGLAPSLRLGSNREFPGLWHPADPSGRIEPYAEWVEKLARRYAGQVDHYVIGDEENRDLAPAAYLEGMLIPLAAAIRRGDPAAGISPCATSSSPATRWTLDLIAGGLPKHADGIACNFWSTQIDDRWEIEDLMARVRAVWPEAKFYGSGMVYAVNRGPDDRVQAASVAQCMFNLWDISWDSAPYYLYAYSLTADTRENYGIAELPTAERPLQPSAAWKAYQAIARTFDDRTALKASAVRVSTRPAAVAAVEDGTTIRLGPPAPRVRVFERAAVGDRTAELVIYLAVPNVRRWVSGRVDVIVETDRWAEPHQIPLDDHTARQPLASHRDGGRLVIPGVIVGTEPAIVVLRPAR